MANLILQTIPSHLYQLVYRLVMILSSKTLDSHIEITPGIAGGRPRIAGHRIKVQDIVIWHEWQGMCAAEIAVDYDLSLADIYAALAYYFDHRSEIDEQIKADDKFVEEMRKNHHSPLAEKLKKLNGQSS